MAAWRRGPWGRSSAGTGKRRRRRVDELALVVMRSRPRRPRRRHRRDRGGVAAVVDDRRVSGARRGARAAPTRRVLSTAVAEVFVAARRPMTARRRSRVGSRGAAASFRAAPWSTDARRQRTVAAHERRGSAGTKEMCEGDRRDHTSTVRSTSDWQVLATAAGRSARAAGLRISTSRPARWTRRRRGAEPKSETTKPSKPHSSRRIDVSSSRWWPHHRR
jgi:hypothetical protein